MLQPRKDHVGPIAYMVAEKPILDWLGLWWDRRAYRRDRRKDALLQENGYSVLRFLAEDAGKYLDQVLDAILRALSHQCAKI
jgi:very-short-patch-repair endonuclease